jgi:hypothetical protein
LGNGDVYMAHTDPLWAYAPRSAGAGCSAEVDGCAGVGAHRLCEQDGAVVPVWGRDVDVSGRGETCVFPAGGKRRGRARPAGGSGTENQTDIRSSFFLSVSGAGLREQGGGANCARRSSPSRIFLFALAGLAPLVLPSMEDSCFPSFSLVILPSLSLSYERISQLCDSMVDASTLSLLSLFSPVLVFGGRKEGGLDAQ